MRARSHSSARKFRLNVRHSCACVRVRPIPCIHSSSLASISILLICYIPFIHFNWYIKLHFSTLINTPKRSSPLYQRKNRTYTQFIDLYTIFMCSMCARKCVCVCACVRWFLLSRRRCHGFIHQAALRSRFMKKKSSFSWMRKLDEGEKNKNQTKKSNVFIFFCERISCDIRIYSETVCVKIASKKRLSEIAVNK